MEGDVMISVCIPAYNHERYVARCVESVLRQACNDVEIVVTDDASTDGTFAELSRFKDDRIRIYRNEANQGPSAATNNNLRHARGKYVAFLSSDDMFLPGKLEKQRQVLDRRPEIGAVFTHMEFVGEDGETGLRPSDTLLDQLNKPRHAWLRQFFDEGNFLSAPTAMLRREALDQIGWLDERLLQTQDFDLWIRLCMRWEIHVIEEPLVRYQVRSGLKNTDAPTRQKIARTYWEMSKVLHHFRGLSGDLVEQVFPDLPESPDFSFELRLALYAVQSLKPWTRAFGSDLLYEELANPTNARSWERVFGYPEFFRLIAEADPCGAGAIRNLEEKLDVLSNSENTPAKQRLPANKGLFSSLLATVRSHF